MAKSKVLATLIGSFPFKQVDVALDLIFKYTPEIPCWPQLPRRNIREGMVAQFSEGLPCLKVNEKGIYLDEQNKEKELEDFYQAIINHDIERFKISEEFSIGIREFWRRLDKADIRKIKFIKCQVTGPFTFAASINDASGRAILYDEVYFQAITKGLMMKALWQIKLFKKFGKDVILFFDEPYLACFGSGYTPLNREIVVKVLDEITQGLKQERVFLGLHCCGNTDWSIFMQIKGLDIISFDAFGYLDKFILYDKQIGQFLKRKGILCWGIVPTQGFGPQVTLTSLSEKIAQAQLFLKAKGIDEKLLKENMLFSPACGLGSIAEKEVKPLLALLSDFTQGFKSAYS